jgi:predicted nuclease of predicted toxin-antitoxin system
VKLLFDQNVSHKLVGMLAREFPGSLHVRDVGLRAAEDRQVWDHARLRGVVIVSKDTDFRELSYVEGFPPKTIRLDASSRPRVRVAAGDDDRCIRNRLAGRMDDRAGCYLYVTWRRIATCLELRSLAFSNDSGAGART